MTLCLIRYQYKKQSIVNESRKLKEDCQKYGFYYFDTFNDRTATLNNIVEIVRKENKQ